MPLSERAVEYVDKLQALPEAGAERLAFFQEHLEDEDPLLAQDSYDEFARAPYADVIALGPQMKRERLLEWINDPTVGPSGRRLYLTMLGICGKPEDVAHARGAAALRLPAHEAGHCRDDRQHGRHGRLAGRRAGR